MRLSKFMERHRIPVIISGAALLVCLTGGILLFRPGSNASAPVSASGAESTAETADLSEADFREIRAEYTGTAYEGERFDLGRVKVSAILTDGREIAIQRFDYDGADSYGGKSTYKILTAYGETDLTVDPILIESVRAPEDGTYTAGNEYSGNLELIYKDQTTRMIKSSEVTFPEGSVLKNGLNAIPFLYEGCQHTLYVNAGSGNTLSEARSLYKDEIQGSVYNSISDQLFVTVTHVGGEVPYYLTHIILSNPSQLRIGTANQTYGSYLSPVSAAAVYRWVVGINGSAVTQMSGTDPVMQAVSNGCVIRNGQLLISGSTTGNEICLTSEGALFSPPAGVSAEELLNERVTDTLVTTEPLLIQDGRRYAEGSDSQEEAAEASAIGMVRPGEYYFLTSDGQGFNCREMQTILSDLGCAYARPTGTGISTALLYKTTPIYNGTNEPIQDFIYITE